MNLRQSVRGQYGPEVVAVLDRYAESMYQESCDYTIGRTDRQELQKGEQLSLKQQLIDLKGPVTTLRIHVASTADREELLKHIETFHDVDMELDKFFKHNHGVMLDSESGELFVHANEANAPLVIARLETKYPTVRWTTIPIGLDFSSVRPCSNWPNARDWLKLKYGREW